MIKGEEIDVWNLSHDGVARCGAVEYFNIVGQVRDPDTLEKFTYQLNDGPATPVFFVRPGVRSGRLSTPGEFGIDTIRAADLKPENVLRFRTTRNGGRHHLEEVSFRAEPFEGEEPRFRLDLEGVKAAEEVGQVVEGPWQVTTDSHGRTCLEVTPENAGYDRIILFGRKEWTTGYEVYARLVVSRIIGRHNIGLIFKWNPHKRGDGTKLPKTWSSGLAYYCSYAKRPGIRIRYGVQVRRDESGRKQGDYVLAERPLNTHWGMMLTRMKQVTKLSVGATDLKLNRDYCFRMRVHPKRYELTIWPADGPEPSPLVVDEPVDRLPQGSVGILAYKVGVRLYEFEVVPVNDSAAG
jgi:hypothetical protein